MFTRFVLQLLIKSRYTSLLIFLSLSMPFNILYAKAEEETKPKVSIQIYIVPEKEACKPNGYPSYKSGLSSNCIQLNMKDIEEWDDFEYTQVIRGIPPSEISLGNSLFNILDAYQGSSKSNPSIRKSIVLIFDWGKHQNVFVSLNRKIIGKSNIGIRERNWSRFLKNERRWIHHERADAFLPANNIKWTLKSGEFTWKFKTRR